VAPVVLETLALGAVSPPNVRKGGRPWFPTGGPQQPNAQPVPGRPKADRGGTLGAAPCVWTQARIRRYTLHSGWTSVG